MKYICFTPDVYNILISASKFLNPSNTDLAAALRLPLKPENAKRILDKIALSK